MRREQILKICLNHHLTKETDYIPKDEKSWLFHTADFSEGEIAHEQFCIRFKNTEIAQEFKKAVTDAVMNIDGSNTGNDLCDSNNNSTASPVKFTNDINLFLYSGLAVLALALCYVYLKRT